jgi:hypothetical protein
VSDQWSQFDSEQTNPESTATDESSANGVGPDYAVGIAEPLGGAAAPSDAELGKPSDSTAAADERIDDDAPVSEVAEVPAQTETPAPTLESGGASLAADDGSAFIAELARAMQATAGLERIRISEDIDRRRQDEIDRVQARKASEADRMRELANEDMAAIDAWVDRETARIQLDRERRVAAVREDLAASLTEHGSKIDKEIEGIDAAIAVYRAEVSAYFENLDRETDPILIAQKAALRPAFPALDAVGEAVAVETPADTDAAAVEPASTDEPEVVGVMDPAAPAEPVESWAAAPEASSTPDPVESSVDVDQTGTAPEADEPVAASDQAVAAAVSPTIGGGGALLQSIPAKRPMSWLRRSED